MSQEIVDKPRKLTPKQQRFVEEYLVDLNGTQAAIRAGYSEKTAKVIASETLTLPNVSAALKEALAKQSKRTEVNADWVLKRLHEESEADIADIYTENGGLKPIHQWPKIWRTGLISGIKSKQEFDYVDGKKVPDGVVHEVKLSERVRRIELIGKHTAVGAFIERMEHTGKDGKDLIPAVSAEELARRIAFTLAANKPATG